jgi:general L-amino acid transport system substrate-binding protein
MRKIILGLSLFTAAALAAGPASAGGVLDAVRARGTLKCGIPQASAGFAAPDSAGVVRGMDADVCRAIAAAVFGDATKVEFLPTTAQQRFPALQTGEVDVLSRQTTWTFSRDTQLGLNFAPVILYDGQGFMVKKSLNVTTAKQLDGASICLQLGSTTELNVSDYFRANNMKFTPIAFENIDEIRGAFFSGRCDVYSTDRSNLAVARAMSPGAADFLVLPETISKEPLAPAVRHGDDQWFDIVKWTVYALITAEEMGLTKANVEKIAAETKDPEIKRFLGGEAGFSKGAQLDDKWALNVIKAVGNYGELYEANLGPNTPLALTRGLNNLWNKGGLMYSPPVR